jgi:hypothetical protein
MTAVLVKSEGAFDPGIRAKSVVEKKLEKNDQFDYALKRRMTA